MKSYLVAAGLVIAFATTPAFAGLATVGVVEDAFTPGLAPTGPDYTVTGSIVGTNIAAFDGNLVFDLTNLTGASLVVTVADFVTIQTDLRISIFTEDVTGAFLAGINFEQAGGTSPSAFWVAGTASDGALAANVENIFTFDLSGFGTYALSPQGGFATGSTYTQISLLFAFDAAGDRLQLDAVGNGAQVETTVTPLPPAAWTGIGVLLAAGATSMRRRRRLALEGARLFDTTT